MDMTKNIDWSEELNKNYDDWTNHGKNVLEESCKCKDQDKTDCKEPDNKDCDCCETNARYSGYCEHCDISEDECQPMMNYGYSLRGLPDEENILKIVKQTCLTVMEHEPTGEIYLALCGGGMDLSQSIALAYLLAGHRIPDELCLEVCTQPCLSVSKKDYLWIMKEVKEELKNLQARSQYRIKMINETVKKFKSEQKKGLSTNG